VDVRLTCQPGDPAKPNEDAVVAVPGLLAVLDGVTSPDGLATGCVHDPSWYVRRLSAHLAGGHLTAPEADLVDIVAGAIKAVREEHGGRCDLDHPGNPQSTLAALRLDPVRCEYLLLGDSTIVLEHGGTVTTVTDRRNYDVSRRLRAARPARPTRIGSSEHTKRILGAQQRMRQHVNRPDGYWVAAADPGAARHAVRGHLHGDGLVRAALLTDGASCVVDQYDLTDWPGLLDLIETHGAGHVVDLARDTERADPDGSARPRPKRHDDATVAYCRLIPRR